MVAAVIVRQGRVLVTRRPAGVHLAGLWEFPGGKLQTGESEAKALERELLEEVGIRVQVGQCLARVSHRYPEKTVALAFFLCALRAGEEPQALEVEAFVWADREALGNLQMPAADESVVRLLLEGLLEFTEPKIM